MKSIKTAVFGAVTLAAAASMAHATDIFFTGSTAFRGPTVQAIHNIFDSGSLTYGYTGTSENSQHAGVYSGTIATVPYIIKTAWTGSEAGIQTVSQDSTGQAIFFASDEPTVAGTPTPLTAGGLQNIDDPTASSAGSTPSRWDFEVPQADMSDTYQASSQFRPGNTLTYVDSSTHTFPNLSSTVVGIVPFNFVISRSGTATVTNISDEQVRNLFGNGFLPRALFSGSTADETARVYATGRDFDSGTRLSALIDTGIGSAGTVKQYDPFDVTNAQVTAVNHTVASLELWPAETIDSLALAANNGGYNSGGSLAGAIGSVTTSMVSTDGHTGGDLLTYLGVSDTATAVGGGAGVLNYNGVPENTTTIEEGQYTYWSFEHLNHLSGLANPTLGIVNSIGASIASTYATTGGAGIFSSSMKVTRFGATNKDGGAIVPTYTY